MEFTSPGAAARLNALYTGSDIAAQRARTLELAAPPVGARCLDVGCGPGFLAVELAAAVGPQGRVLAVDRSATMVDAARARAEEAGHAGLVRTSVADATALPCDDASVDIATVVQVLEYVPRVEDALTELYRVLRPGGRVVVIDTDWRSCVWTAGDRDRTDRVLRAWEEHFVHPHLPTRLASVLEGTGFTDITVEVIPVVNLAPSSESFSRGMVDTIARWLRRQERVATGDLDAWRNDVLTHEPYFFSLCRFAFCATRR